MALLMFGALVSGFLFRKKISASWTDIKARPWEDIFRLSTHKYGLPPGMLARMAWVESRFDPMAYNAKSGATGMMQIIPKYHPDLADPRNPQLAIPYAAKYLSQLFNQFGSWDKAIASYNWGQGNVARVIQSYGNAWRSYLPKETREYLDQVESVVKIA